MRSYFELGVRNEELGVYLKTPPLPPPLRWEGNASRVRTRESKMGGECLAGRVHVYLRNEREEEKEWRRAREKLRK